MESGLNRTNLAAINAIFAFVPKYAPRLMHFISPLNQPLTYRMFQFNVLNSAIKILQNFPNNIEKF